jgi:hypothetical protein
VEKLDIGDKINDILQNDRSGLILVEHMILHLGTCSPMGVGLPELILTRPSTFGGREGNLPLEKVCNQCI